MTLSTRDFANVIFDKIGFKPNPAQEPIIFDETHKQILVSGGEQGGKSVVASKYMLPRIFDHPYHDRCWMCSYLNPDTEAMAEHIMERQHGGFFWLVGESYGETEREFSYLKEDLGALRQIVPGKSGATEAVDPGHIKLLDGTLIETKSGKDIKKFSKVAPRGIVICEASQVDYIIYERCRIRITPNDGFLFMAGTIEKGLPWFPRMRKAWASGYEDKISYMLPSYSNLVLYPGGRNDPKILELERDSSDDNFMERIEGQEVPPKGLVFPEVRLDIHVRDIPYDPELPVYIWEDPGYSDAGAHAIELAQILRDETVNVFDEIYVRGILHKDIIANLRNRFWWKREKKVVSDPHYFDQHGGGTNSVRESWLEEAKLRLSWNPRIKKVPINMGSERLKSFLKVDALSGQPKIFFSPKCRGFLSEVGITTSVFNKERDENYMWEVDDFGDHVGKTPIDRYNHACKAVIYGLVEHFGYTRAQERPRNRQKNHMKRRVTVRV